MIEGKTNARVTVMEVSPRDGLQNEDLVFSPDQKLKLIKYYDDHNIFILPSFTEGYPMVLLESLARRRPVIVFEDIKHVVGDKKHRNTLERIKKTESTTSLV